MSIILVSYHPTFGSPMPTRTWSDPNAKYKYGFNGKEKDNGDEGVGGGGSTYDYGFRIYNPNLGRFLSVDPLFSSYPWYTPYQFAGNKVICAIDIDGLEEAIVTYYKLNSKTKVRVQFVDPSSRTSSVCCGSDGFDYVDQLVNSSNNVAIRQSYLNLFSPEYMLWNFKIVDYYVASDNGTFVDCDGKKYEKKTGPLKEAFGNFKTLPIKIAGTNKTRWSNYRSFGIKIEANLNIYFKNDKSTLNAEGVNGELNTLSSIRSQLNSIGAKMVADPSLVLDMVGFTDKDADNTYNNNLSQQRINSVKDYLKTNFNIDESRFRTSNKGETNANQTEKKAEDRKVELNLVKETI